MRAMLAVVGALLLVGTSLAADAPDAARREYHDRLIAMENTAAAQADLARWCEKAGLDDRARVHWQEVLFREENHKEARAALGYVWRNMQWTRAADLPSPAAILSAAALSRSADLSRRQEIAREVRAIALGYLGTADPAMRQEGRRRLLALAEPEAVDPIVRILGTGDETMRSLACEALGRIPGDEAAKALVRFVLGDEPEPVYRAAVAALAARRDRAALQPLVNALNGSPKALEKAAFALGEIGDLAAAPALVGQLQRPETRILKAPASSAGRAALPGAYMFTGQVVTYIADADPIVSDRAVGWDLQIGAIPIGTMLSVHNPRVYIYRTIIEIVRRPVVRNALHKMTGQDFEYNAEAWRRWLRESGAAPSLQP